MAFQRKNATFVGYLDIPLSGEDLATIMQNKDEVDTNLTEILTYAAPLKLDIKVAWDDENDRWKATLYNNDPKHEWAGIGIRGTGDFIEIAISTLAHKISLVGKRDWLTLVRKSGDTVNGIS